MKKYETPTLTQYGNLKQITKDQGPSGVPY